ncbi:hypothetical protein A3B18_02745 [Candidatus Giovannonibacteria bacterium RIFCSPLOWO2_01_FULL_46_13]|uniref:Methyltransferase type 11 domain-containing protein n=1 Tax=Candidatus Giovannonibacteria bacterium RIFCSPLOWO2_01_FULL_46_13 TaxID=1798352 RepID=A0A1F5X2U6_9BACT|nr:MAG: hypothetical protein A3B18_02745 [Candidatus Giovannonibacteria bacterium RIFCSPLOWO2_01_FULL_46_13]
MTQAPKFSVGKIYASIVKDAFLNAVNISKIKRDRAQVLSDYEPSWKRAKGDVLKKNYKYRPMFFNGKPVMLRRIDYMKFSLEKLSEEISKIKAESVLELGSGDGFVTLAMAVMHPEVKIFRGIDLTESGIETATHNLSNPPIEALSFVSGLDAEVVRERISGRDIKFVRGDMLSLPFEENSFDTVFSRLAIEQIPDSYPSVFKEARRVAKIRAVFLEEFLEAQKNIFQRMHLKNRDFFRASFKEVERAGFKVEKFEALGLGKIEFTIGMLVCSPGGPNDFSAQSEVI